MSDHVVTIAGAAGMWGDSSLATQQLLADGRADYVVYEALAEVTMAILARAHHKDPAQGYARDIVATIATHLGDLTAAGMKVVTNAGGVNPTAAAAIIRGTATDAGLELKVATITGDDLGDRIADLQALDLRDREDGHPVPSRPLALHAYLGARQIAAALDAGADIVVTGRVVDSALALGPLVHEHGWDWGDFDMLSAGSLAGHLVECGPQATGGLLTDWEDTASWIDPGYPLAMVAADGHTTVSTPTDSDGLVDARTVTEQLLYEIGDPRAYLLPDVTCDWADVTVREVGPDRVEVTGARGTPPPSTLKAIALVPDGFKTTFLLFIAGRDAVAKARRVGEDLLARGERMLAARGLPTWRATSIEVLGSEATWGRHGRRDDTREVVLALGVAHDDREAVGVFVREVPSMGLAGPPGVSGGGTGLPRPTPIIRLASFPVPRGLVVPKVELDGVTLDLDQGKDGQVKRTGDGPVTKPTMDTTDGAAVAAAATPAGPSHRAPPAATTTPTVPTDDTIGVPLVAIAHGRSGDKGAHVNVGLRARHPDFLPVVTAVTAEQVADWLAHLGATSVRRFDLPGIDAVNFLLHDGLGAASAASLRFDPQGKAIAQQLLDMPVPIPVAWSDHPAFRQP